MFNSSTWIQNKMWTIETFSRDGNQFEDCVLSVAADAIG